VREPTQRRPRPVIRPVAPRKIVTITTMRAEEWIAPTPLEDCDMGAGGASILGSRILPWAAVVGTLVMGWEVWVVLA